MSSKYEQYQQQEHDFAPFIRILGKGKKGTRSLTQAESYQAFSMILQDKVLAEQLGAFMMLLRVKEESVDELVGFVRAVKEDIDKRFTLNQQLTIQLDWSSYAGKRKYHAWYLLSALTLAKHGVTVCMHGAKGHTANRIYSEDLLEAMGYPIVTKQSDIAKHLNQHNFCYLPMRVMQPKLAEIIQMRNVFGLRSPVHTLSRLINPFNAPVSLQSIFHSPYQQSHLWAARKLGYTNTLVIKGDGGEFERNPDTRTKVMGMRNASPYDMKLPVLNQVKTSAENNMDATKLLAVWQGEAESAFGYQAITETLALTLIALKKAQSYQQAVQLAQALWHSRHDTQTGLL